MNEVWNLDPIYRGFDDPAFDRDLTELKDAVAEFASWTRSMDADGALEGLKAGIAHQEKLYTTGSRLVEYAMLRQSADTQDTEAGSRIGQIMAAGDPAGDQLDAVSRSESFFQSICSRSCLPMTSMGCLASCSRLELKKQRPFLFSAIHLPAKVPS